MLCFTTLQSPLGSGLKALAHNGLAPAGFNMSVGRELCALLLKARSPVLWHVAEGNLL